MPPWKLGGGTRTLWYARYEAMRKAENKRAEHQQKEAERIRNRK